MVKNKDYPLVNREISWLAFNDRVLQEAMDESVPLIERVRFLGIFSNNRDEFFRVRMATLKRIITIGKKGASYLQGQDPNELLEQIQKIVIKQEKNFAQTYRKIIKELRKKDIHIIDESGANERQKDFVMEYFRTKVRSALVPILLNSKAGFPYLKEQTIYLAIKLYNKKDPEDKRFAIMEVPSKRFGRFFVLPQVNGEKYIMLLDDVIRTGLKEVFTLFNYDTIESYTIKLTRDAELDIDDDISKSLIDKLSKSLKGRARAKPTRFVYDANMPEDLHEYIMGKLKLKKSDNLIAGGRYHNFRDFIDFPSIGVQKLRYSKLPPVPHPSLEKSTSLLKVISRRDILLFYPYQPFRHVIDMLREAAIDPKVKSIEMCLYRVASNSQIINALTNAVKNGKNVTVLVELHARFDEEANIEWAKKLQVEGVKVIHGVPGLKVHSKLFMISRREGKSIKKYAHIGTGNFHEGTAGIYTDHSLLTSDPRITNEVAKVFDFFRNNYKVARYSHLLVSPVNTRRKFMKLISAEIKNARAGKKSGITIKLNSLLDEALSKKIYEAGRAGVPIRMIVRGICSIVPGVKGMSENIEIRSIVDRFLEHSRILVFENNGDPLYFISSADWMGRNLDKRTEVTTPIYDQKLQQQLQIILDYQFSDNQKARIIDGKGRNKYFQGKRGGSSVRSQIAIYRFYQRASGPDSKIKL